MKREEIEKAAKKYANENAYIPSDIYAENNMIEMKESFAEAFREGVEWCINSMWHDAAEEPERETAIIVLFSEKNHEMETVYYTYDSPDDCWEEIKDLEQENAYLNRIIKKLTKKLNLSIKNK